MSRSDHDHDTSATGSLADSKSIADTQLTTESSPVIVVDTAGDHGSQYHTWLESRYEVRHAQSSDDIVVWLEDEQPQVVIFDCTESADTADSLGRELASLDIRCQTLLVQKTGVSMATVERIADECLYAPVNKNRLIDSLERARLITTYDAIVAELLTLEMRRDMLREGVSPIHMSQCSDFRRLTIRTVTLLGALIKLYHRLVMQSATDPLLRTEYGLSPDDFKPHD